MRELPVIVLTPEQEEEAAAIEDILGAKSQATTKYMARLMASKGNRQLLGETEFLLRDAVHRLGAEGIDIALHERKKRGTAGVASTVPAVEKTPDSWTIEHAR